MLPEWMSQPVGLRAARRWRSGYLSRTLRGIAGAVEDSLFCERAARRDGFLQHLDARAKLVPVLALAVGATFLHHIPPLLALGAYALAALLASRVGLRTVFSRAWWIIPAAFALVALPSALSVFVPGEPVLVLTRGISITRQGLATAGLLATRVMVGVMFALLLVLTTRWQELLRAAYTSATAPFVLVATMMYRYVFVLLRVAENMHLGKRARTICPGTAAQERKWVGSRIGALYVRSRHLSEQVYAAMLARGYRGEPRALTQPRLRLGEAGWVAGCMLALAAALLADRLLLRAWRW